MMAQNIVQQDVKIERSVPRTHLFLSATIRFDQVPRFGCADSSESGARIEGVSLPAIGKTAQISRGSLQMAGTTSARGQGVWRALRRPAGARPMAADSGRAGPVDRRRDDRRRALGQPHLLHHPPEPIPIEPASGLLSRRLAEELAYVARLLDSLGDLCGEPGRRCATPRNCRPGHFGANYRPCCGGAGGGTARPGDRSDRHDEPPQAAPAQGAVGHQKKEPPEEGAPVGCAPARLGVHACVLGLKIISFVLRFSVLVCENFALEQQESGKLAATKHIARKNLPIIGKNAMDIVDLQILACCRRMPADPGRDRGAGESVAHAVLAANRQAGGAM